MNDTNRTDHSDDKKGHWHEFTEEIEVAGQKLVEEVTRLISEGNVRRLRVRSVNDEIVIEVPLTAGAAVGGVLVLAAPWLVLLGGLAGLVARVKIEVVREEPPADGDSAD
jgi:phage terminase large subunit-like protein